MMSKIASLSLVLILQSTLLLVSAADLQPSPAQEQTHSLRRALYKSKGKGMKMKMKSSGSKGKGKGKGKGRMSSKSGKGKSGYKGKGSDSYYKGMGKFLHVKSVNACTPVSDRHANNK